MVEATPAAEFLTFQKIEASWRSAFAAARSAIEAAASLGAGKLAESARRLAAERASTLDLLQAVARAERVAIATSWIDLGSRNGWGPR